jgi:hypothetical protein
VFKTKKDRFAFSIIPFNFFFHYLFLFVVVAFRIEIYFGLLIIVIFTFVHFHHGLKRAAQIKKLSICLSNNNISTLNFYVSKKKLKEQGSSA